MASAPVGIGRILAARADSAPALLAPLRPSRGSDGELVWTSPTRRSETMSLIKSIARFARSRQGRRLADQAMRYAQSPEGKRRIEQGREQLAGRRTRPR